MINGKMNVIIFGKEDKLKIVRGKNIHEYGITIINNLIILKL